MAKKYITLSEITKAPLGRHYAFGGVVHILPNGVGVLIGKNVKIGKKFRIVGDTLVIRENVTIGDNVEIHHGWVGPGVTIGNNVKIGNRIEIKGDVPSGMSVPEFNGFVGEFPKHYEITLKDKYKKMVR